MKKITRISIFIIMISLVLHVLMANASSDTLARSELRGVWVATVLNIDYPSKSTIEPEILKAEALEILDNAAYMGLNAVFLQVRPASDAIYKSQYFPWSKYLTGTQGQGPEGDYDPLRFWVEEAHKRGLELHAWINPYRVTKKTSTELKHDFDSLHVLNPARLNPSWVVKHTDGNLYFDPGLPEVRKLVIDGILEIIKNYEIDGIHFDDYFYPGKEFNDQKTYQKYGAGFSSISEWRRDNVNLLIRDLSKAIKETKENIRFGISPVGIWANKKTNPLGSDTQGMQAYYDQFADSRKWVKEGWVDYIVPQIYWNIGFAIADYSKLLTWWMDTVKDTGVDLYIGQAAYRTGNADPSSPWYGVSEIEKQLKLNAIYPEVKGSIYFSYKSFANNPSLSSVIKADYLQKDGMNITIPVTVSRPSGNIKTSLGQYYLNGSSDPDKPLFLNGKLVEGRSDKGYYGILVPLEKGQNMFTFSQGASSITRVIDKDAVSSLPKRMNEIEIPEVSAFPQVDEYRMPGEKITFSCQAPRGSTVTVKIDGESYGMNPSAPATNDQELYADTFTYIHTMPSQKGTPRVVDLGEPVYTVNYIGIEKVTKATGKIGVIMKDAPYYAEVVKGVLDTYSTPSSSNGAAYELYSGMVDSITGITGTYARLSSGQWVNKKDIKIYNTQSPVKIEVKKASYSTGEKWEILNLDMPTVVAAYPSFDGVSLKLDISMATSAPIPILPKDAMFSSVTVSQNDNNIQYILQLKNDQCIEGFYVKKNDASISLYIKKPLAPKGGDQPLEGTVIMLDPGHGGSDSGAVGPLGLNYAEKAINLNTAIKLQAELEKRGATVLMTRTADNNVSLEDRLTASRDAKPDLFISIHANSMADNVDISKVDGFSVFYREKFANSLSETVHNHTINSLNRNSKGVHNKNFYVLRGTWTPSILIENGFVPNPNEFEWLTNENEQQFLAKSMADAVANYFNKPSISGK